MPGTPSREGAELARLRRTERTMVRVRWAAVAFGIVQALTFYRPYPRGALAAALGVMAVLALGNLGVWVAYRRADGVRGMRRVGLAALALDVVAVSALLFVYAFDPDTAIFAVAYILPLEGAIRFGLRGAMVTMGVATLLYTCREVFGTVVFGNEFLPVSITFRMGIGFLIGAVSGSMASNLVEDRREAEEATARYESMLAAMSHLGEGFVIADAERILYANQALGDILGYAPEELTGMASWREVMDSATHVPQPGEFDLVAGERFETSILHRKGHRIDVEVGVKPAELDGQPRFVGIVRDITARKRAEAELATAYDRERRAVKRLQELDAVKTDFLATVSHELRTPVTKVVGFAATLMARWDSLDNEMRQECIRRIAAGGDQLSRLIAELLDFGRIERGNVRFELVPCSLAGVVKATIRDLDGILDQHVVHTELAADTVVLANPDALSRVLDNLVTNAVKFSPPGSTITVRALPEGDDQVRVEVQDEGIGIPPEEAARVFDRFHRLHRDATAPSGTGIGLAIVKEFVEAQGGRAWASTGPAGGAVLSFTLWRPGHLPAGLGSELAAGTTAPR